MERDDVLVGLVRSYLVEELTRDQLRPLAASSRARSLTNLFRRNQKVRPAP